MQSQREGQNQGPSVEEWRTTISDFVSNAGADVEAVEGSTMQRFAALTRTLIGTVDDRKPLGEPTSVPGRTLDRSPSLTIEEAEAVFNDWAAASRFVSCEEFTEVQRVSDISLFEAKLIEMFDERRTESRTGPGWRGHDEASTWPQLAPSFNEQRVERVKQGSVQSAACSRCRAIGRIRCDRCAASGRLPCSPDEQCSRCRGTGEQGSSEQKSRCTRCAGRGRETCRRCNGSGWTRCSPCRGSGELTCSTCHGDGATHRYVALVLQRRQRTKTMHPPSQAATPSFIKESDWSLPRTYAVDSPPTDLTGPEAQWWSDHLIPRQDSIATRCEVRHCSVTATDYVTARGDERQAWIVGGSNRVIAPSVTAHRTRMFSLLAVLCALIVGATIAVVFLTT